MKQIAIVQLRDHWSSVRPHRTNDHWMVWSVKWWIWVVETLKRWIVSCVIEIKIDRINHQHCSFNWTSWSTIRSATGISHCKWLGRWRNLGRSLVENNRLTWLLNSLIIEFDWSPWELNKRLGCCAWWTTIYGSTKVRLLGQGTYQPLPIILLVYQLEKGNIWLTSIKTRPVLLLVRK